MDFIDRLREKSPTTKKQIAFVTSAVLTLAIFGLWMTVFHFGIDSKPSNITATVSDARGSGSISDVDPFSAFWDVLSKGWDGLTDNVNQIKTGAGQVQDFVKTLGGATSTAVTSSQPTSEPTPQNDVFILNSITQ